MKLINRSPDIVMRVVTYTKPGFFCSISWHWVDSAKFHTHHVGSTFTHIAMRVRPKSCEELAPRRCLDVIQDFDVFHRCKHTRHKFVLREILTEFSVKSHQLEFNARASGPDQRLGASTTSWVWWRLASRLVSQRLPRAFTGRIFFFIVELFVDSGYGCAWF